MSNKKVKMTIAETIADLEFARKNYREAMEDLKSKDSKVLFDLEKLKKIMGIED